MEVIALKRVFIHGEIELQDPDELMSQQEVLDFYSGTYPELTNSSVAGPTIQNDRVEFTFTTSVGEKG